MKGLLKKDLYMFWGYTRFFLLMAVLFVILSGYASGSLFLLVYPMIIVAILPVTLLSYDERFKWNIYCDAMPLTRKQVVSEKYLLTLIVSLIMLLLVCLSNGIALLIRREPLSQLLEIITVLLPFGLVAPSLILPFIFFLGPEKGRIAYLVLIGCFCAAALILSDKLITNLPQMGRPAIGLLLVLCISALVFAGSWLVSVRLYQKREL
jgi:hypothetical protein